MIKNIVIIDDTKSKADEISLCIKEILGNVNVIIKNCHNMGLYEIIYRHGKEVEENPEEWLVITDMVMPYLSGETPEADAGYGVLTELERKGFECPVMVATACDTTEFRNVEDNAKKLYKHYIGTLRYDPCVYMMPQLKELLDLYID